MDSDASDSPHTPVPRSVLGDEIELDSTTDVNTSHISPLGPSTSSPVLDTEFTDTLPLSDSDIDGPSDAASAGSFADIEDNNDDDNISHLEYYSRISASFQDRYTMQLPRERLDTGISGSADTLGLRIPEVAEVDAFADEETSDDDTNTKMKMKTKTKTPK
ncbi:hypothetical protein BD779DRAFT_587981 [Infundibulicybe gibba]|nr:hypothetical protein BD779DRAFT_587981 [Infundibulicybe gibba]